MPTQQQVSNKKIRFHNKQWSYYVFFHQNDKTSRSGPWSHDIAHSLRNELLINNVCAWVKRLDENKQ